MTTAPQAKGTRLFALDAIRGAAVMMIICWHVLPQAKPDRHSLLAAVNSLSWAGVDLFFVLSGFLIVGILLDNRGAENYFGVFYLRRALRILPLYFLVLLGSAYHWNDHSPLPYYLLFLQNLLMSATGAFGNLGVTWSLAVEEQFYLLAPVLVRKAARHAMPLILIVAILAAPLCRYLCWELLPERIGKMSALTLLPCRMDCLAMGGLVAWAIRDPFWRAALRERLRSVLLAGAGCALALAILASDIGATDRVLFSVTGGTLLVLIFGALFVWVALSSVELPPILRRLFEPLALIGTGAYAIYLIHPFLVDWADQFVRAHSLRGTPGYLGELALVMAGSWLIAWASWTCVEGPIIRFSHRFRYRDAALSGAVGWNAPWRRRIPWRRKPSHSACRELLLTLPPASPAAQDWSLRAHLRRPANLAFPFPYRASRIWIEARIVS